MKLKLKAHVRKAGIQEFDNYQAWRAAVEARGLTTSNPYADAENGPDAHDLDQTIYAYRTLPPKVYDLGDEERTEELGCFDFAFDKGVLFDTHGEFNKWIYEGDEPQSITEGAF